ncbi:MAG: cellulase family glycosylhydrolase [Phycisphaerae bacterium]|jgi:hypothetical protein|nr:cellulase family glycosylhydrolase [Phycisphaerae bacterium]
MTTIIRSFVLAFATLVGPTIVIADGVWITPAWPDGREPQFKPVGLYWFSVRESPLVYRRQVDVAEGVDRAVAAIRTSGYVYVYVDGRFVYGWSPQRGDKRRNKPAVPADPKRVHIVDLTSKLGPGRHVLAVSAPAGGFVLDGGVYKRSKRLARLSSDEKWTVLKFRPTTVLEDQASMKVGAAGKGPAVSVKQGRSWRADPDMLASSLFGFAIDGIKRSLSDSRWRLDLAVKKGIYLHGLRVHQWGGPFRLAPVIEKLTAKSITVESLTKAQNKLSDLARNQVNDVAAFKRLSPRLEALETSAAATSSAIAAAMAGAYESDRSKARQLAGKIDPSARTHVGDLNESCCDRLGWINHGQLTDSDIALWGVRVNPAVGPADKRLHYRWRFSTDPKNIGLKELRYTIGYNIANQWSVVDGRQSWTKNPSFENYAGPAWYRQIVHLPSQWAGNTVVLKLRLAGKGRVWFNDREITKLARSSGVGMTFDIPSSHVVYGGRNCLALRVDASGEQRGLLGPTEIACPSFALAGAGQTPKVDIQVTPLSPCVILQPKTDCLHLHHAGKAQVAARPGGAKFKWSDLQVRVADGAYALLWLKSVSKTGTLRPILLVFEKRGSVISCGDGLTKIKLTGPNQRVIAVRPWVENVPVRRPESPPPAVKFWSRAALAVPVNYVSTARLLQPGGGLDGISIDNIPRGPRLGHTVIYDYLITRSDSGARPLKIAPLPALCSFAVDCKYRTLRLDQADKVAVFQDGGLIGPYRGLKDADRISYSYRIEPYPRFAGFTSWMFSGVDVGVRGNMREMELIASTGANSYRPQHNWSNETPPRGQFPPDDKRTRVQVMLDACRAVGVNYTNNIDQTLGPRKDVQENYDKWVRTKLFPHFDRLVPQLAPLGFSAAAIDLINEPFDHKAPAYNRTIAELTARIRKVDKRHLLYVEPCQSWGAIQNIALVKPTGDPLTIYSFHDYNFRLKNAADRWPTMEQDITNIYRKWLPAIEYGIRNSVPLHCGEFGGFHEPTNDSPAQRILLNDFFRIFDQFGMHHHYYSGRTIFIRLADGALRPSNVVRAYREYFKRPEFNRHHRLGAP